jgi:hypothetical protein
MLTPAGASDGLSGGSCSLRDNDVSVSTPAGVFDGLSGGSCILSGDGAAAITECTVSREDTNRQKRQHVRNCGVLMLHQALECGVHVYFTVYVLYSLV